MRDVEQQNDANGEKCVCGIASILVREAYTEKSDLKFSLSFSS